MDKTTEAIIFDCFGVLYIDYKEAYFAQYPGVSKELHDLNRACDRGFIDRDEYVQKVSEITGDSPATVNDAFRQEHRANKPLIEYIQAELKPHYKIGMLSNIGRGWMQDFFNEHQLHELFDAVVLSNEEGVTKPEVAIYRRAAEELGVASGHCLMIDDRQENCDGAEAAGMKSIFYETFSQLKAELGLQLKSH